MAREAAFRTRVVADLHRQLQYAPRETVRRQMDAAETLLRLVETERPYPSDFVTWRITGYRPTGTGEAAMIEGGDLVGDLVSLVLRFSRSIGLTECEVERRAMEADALAAELGVSVRTLQRWRGRGLVWHWLKPAAGGDARPVIFTDAIADFRARQPELVARAANFRRATVDERRAIVAAARRLRAADPALTLAAASRRLAGEAPLGREAIRALLVAHERAAVADPGIDADADAEAAAIFRPPAVTDERTLRFVRRADAMGIAVSRLAARLGRDESSIRRAIRRARANRAALIVPAWVELPTFERANAGDVILAPAVVRDGLDDLPSAMEVLEAAATGTADDPAGTDSLAAAMHYLRRRARTALDAAPAWPGEGLIDAVERDLRWAALLRRRLVGAGLVSAMVQAGRVLGTRPSALPRAAVASLLQRSAVVVAAAVDEHDPMPRGAARRASLAARIVRSMDRHLAASSDLATLAPSGRASARADLGEMDLLGIIEAGDPVVRALRPSGLVAALRRGVRIDEASGGAPDRRDIVIRGWALDGRAPASLLEAATERGSTVTAVARLRRGEVRRLRRLGGAIGAEPDQRIDEGSG